jgi:acyl-lipid omega-6 desaturase (Delta-12 desaturase)
MTPTAHRASPPGASRPWQGALEGYTQPRLARSIVDLATSLVPYVVLLLATLLVQRVSLPLSLLLVIPAAGFLIRVFIVFHDCAHGSFLRSRRANDVLGAILGALVWLPFRSWQHEHAVHHATSGDLTRRGIGDITTLTVNEYRELPTLRRVA